MATVVRPTTRPQRREQPKKNYFPQLMGALDTSLNYLQRQQQIETTDRYRQELTDSRADTSEQADIRILMQSGDPRLIGIAGDMMSNRMGNPLAGQQGPAQQPPSVNDAVSQLPPEQFIGPPAPQQTIPTQPIIPPPPQTTFVPKTEMGRLAHDAAVKKKERTAMDLNRKAAKQAEPGYLPRHIAREKNAWEGLKEYQGIDKQPMLTDRQWPIPKEMDESYIEIDEIMDSRLLAGQTYWAPKEVWDTAQSMEGSTRFHRAIKAEIQKDQGKTIPIDFINKNDLLPSDYPDWEKDQRSSPDKFRKTLIELWEAKQGPQGWLKAATEQIDKGAKKLDIPDDATEEDKKFLQNYYNKKNK